MKLCVVSGPSLQAKLRVGETHFGIADSLEGQFLRALHKINAAIERNEARVQESERRESVCREWKQVALVCDRVLLWAFILTTAVTTTAILFSSPHGP